MSTLNPLISSVAVYSGSWTSADAATLNTDDSSYATVTLAGGSSAALILTLDMSSLPDSAVCSAIQVVMLARGQTSAFDTWTGSISFAGYSSSDSGNPFNDVFQTIFLTSYGLSISGSTMKTHTIEIMVTNSGFYSHTFDVDRVSTQITYTYAPPSGFFGSNF